ncbi:RNA polymerase sigma factor [Bowmanella denitrificans]|uniref:RNA polymerase sigma factor n=1 Tax=Bowmanella denitrificans TaxID=366582 RepID=UPI000C9C118A|nr:sigma-70 family RNA polymerase sigma factor [Bowmanella denitrificans]
MSPPSGSYNTSDPCDFASLLERIADGDRAAEQELVHRFWRGLQFILHRQTQDPELVADICQDTFVIVLEKARRAEIDNPLGLAAFIHQVGRNLLSGYFRKEKRRATDSADWLFTVPDPGMEVYQQVYADKVVGWVSAMMDSLPTERDRDILRSYFLHQQSKADICARLSLEADHFDRILSRARQRLKQVILHKLQDPDNKVPSGEIPGLLILALAINTPHLAQLPDLFSNKVGGNAVSQHLLTDTSASRFKTGMDVSEDITDSSDNGRTA